MLGWHTTRRRWLVIPKSQLADWPVDDINTRHYLYESGPYTIPKPAVPHPDAEIEGTVDIPQDVITAMTRSGVLGVQRAISTARGSVSALQRLAMLAPRATVELCRNSKESLEDIIPTLQDTLSRSRLEVHELVHLVPSLTTDLDWIILGYVVNLHIHQCGGGLSSLLIGKTVALWAQAGYWQVADVLSTTIRHKLPMDYGLVYNQVEVRQFQPDYHVRIKQYIRPARFFPDMMDTLANRGDLLWKPGRLFSLKAVAQAALQGAITSLNLAGFNSDDSADSVANLTPPEYQVLCQINENLWPFTSQNATPTAWLADNMGGYDSTDTFYRHIDVPDSLVAIAVNKDGTFDHLALNTRRGYRRLRTLADFMYFWLQDLTPLLLSREQSQQQRNMNQLLTLTKADSTLTLGTASQALTKCITYMRLISTLW